nr:neuroligin-4, X-linked-like [Aedes albopictus]
MYSHVQKFSGFKSGDETSYPDELMKHDSKQIKCTTVEETHLVFWYTGYVIDLSPCLLTSVASMNIQICNGKGSRGLEAPYSIFFYIHGEAYDWGSGNPYDGSVLASYGHVIVVTVNFRLGILGFLKTRASASPGGSGGNLGLMDITLALQWVRDNIGAFGGDPKRITVVGHDTGAALANMVLISKAGKGLINRAILLSGSALSPWALVPNPDAIRMEVSQQMACHLLVDPPPGKPARKPSTDDITECLRDKPLEALMGVRLTAVRFMPSWGPFLPLEDSLDPEFAMEHSGEGFITSELMLGMTTTESYNDFSASDIQVKKH